MGWGGVSHAEVGWVIQGWGGVGHAGVEWVIQGWGGSHRGRMTHTEHYDHLHTVPCGNYLELLREAKFNYNHTHNYLQLLRGHKLNYKHKLRIWIFFIVYQKGDLVKDPMKSIDILPKMFQEWGGVKVDRRAQYNKNFTYVMLYWINFTNNHGIVDFLTLIFVQMAQQSDPDKHVDL